MGDSFKYKYYTLEAANPGYLATIKEYIDKIQPGVFEKINEIDKYPDEVGIKVLRELLGYACQATNQDPIVIARTLIMKMPIEWLYEHFEEASDEILDDVLCDGEYVEYIRLLEVLNLAAPKLLKWAFDIGFTSVYPKVRKMAEKYIKIFPD